MSRALLLVAVTSACGIDRLETVAETESPLEVGVIAYSRNGRGTCEDPRPPTVTLTIEGGGEHGCAGNGIAR